MEKIVVGVDGSTGSQSALRWARAEAARHGTDVVAVMAWSYLDQRHAVPTDTFDPHYGDAQAAEALRTSLEAVGASEGVDQRVVCDLPARALREVGEDADLLVVGARGLGGFKGLLLGSVSERLLECATRPVAVVREGVPATDGGPVVVGVTAATVRERRCGGPRRKRGCAACRCEWCTPGASRT